jgi:hypothetical protein
MDNGEIFADKGLAIKYRRCNIMIFRWIPGDNENREKVPGGDYREIG